MATDNDLGYADEDGRERAKPVKGDKDAEQRQSAEAGNDLRLVPAIAIAPHNQHRAIGGSNARKPRGNQHDNDHRRDRLPAPMAVADQERVSNDGKREPRWHKANARFASTRLDSRRSIAGLQSARRSEG